MNIDEVIARFNKNIVYFQENQNTVFSKLVSFDDAIEKGYYQEKYELVYENDDYDVFEKNTLQYLYAKDIKKHTKSVIDNVHLDLLENLFEGVYNYEISDEDLARYSNLNHFESEISSIALLLHTLQNQEIKSKYLKKLNKFIFFGTGLGRHIEELDKKIASKVYFIIEDDLELFRLSLFVTDYDALSKNATLIFSVFEDEIEFLKTSRIFLDVQYELNRYLKYFYLLSSKNEKIDLFHCSIMDQSHLHFSYNNYLVQSLLPLKYLHGGYSFLNKNVSFLGDFFSSKPVLLLAAGPSLLKNIKWVKEHQNKFIIVSVSVILSILEEEQITPDIVIHLDAIDKDLSFNKIKSFSFLQNTIYLFSAKTAPSMLDKIKRENVFFFENSTSYKEKSFRPSSPCVGSVSYQILLYFGVRNMYLLGLDLAVDSKTGMTHYESHEYSKNLGIEKSIFDGDSLSYKSNLIEVDGNFEKKVYTTSSFKGSIETIDFTTQKIKKEIQNIFNLSNGAKFLGIKPLQTNNILLNSIDKKDISKELLKIFEKESLNILTGDEKTKILKAVVFAKNSKKAVASFLKNIFTSEEEFKKELLTLSKNLTQYFKYDLEYIFDSYFKYVLAYIFDFLNREELELGNKEIEMLQKLVGRELEKIINYYQEKMENIS